MAPILAPSFGQLILLFAPWRALFIVTAIVAWIGVVWMQLRQTESLPVVVPLNLRKFGRTAAHVLTHRQAMGYTVAGSLMFGALLGYVNTSQQVFQGLYGLGASYPLVLGAMGCLVAAGLILNNWLTHRFELTEICRVTILIQLIWCLGFLALFQLVWAGLPPLPLLLVFLSGNQMVIGIVSGNLSAIALKPMGAIAATASSVQNSVATLMALSVAALIGSQLADKMTPILVGYALAAAGTYGIMIWASAGKADVSGEDA